MKSNMAGLTLIELVVVIVIVGILAGAVAIPTLNQLDLAAQKVATMQVANQITSGMSINYAAKKTGSGGVTINNCNQAASVLQGPLPAGYTAADGLVASGATVTCTLSGPNTTSATFIAIGT